jgi:hypothetical protein
MKCVIICILDRFLGVGRRGGGVVECWGQKVLLKNDEVYERYSFERQSR